MFSISRMMMIQIRKRNLLNQRPLPRQNRPMAMSELVRRLKLNLRPRSRKGRRPKRTRYRMIRKIRHRRIRLSLSVLIPMMTSRLRPEEKMTGEKRKISEWISTHRPVPILKINRPSKNNNNKRSRRTSSLE